MLAREESVSAEKRHGESTADSKCCANIVSMGKVGGKKRCACVTCAMESGSPHRAGVRVSVECSAFLVDGME